MASFRFSQMAVGVGLLLTILSGRALPATSLSCGSVVSGDINEAGQVDQYTYAGQAGGVITLTVVQTGEFSFQNSALALTLYDPSGNAVLSFNRVDTIKQQKVNLALTGTYLIRVYASDLADTGTYSLGLECGNPSQPAALSCGVVASGKITASGQVDQYAYAGQAGGIVVLTLAGFNSAYATGATLTEPDGDALVSLFAANQNPVRFQYRLLWTGTYLIQVYAVDLAGTGTYNLEVQCLSGLNGEGFIPVTPCRVADTRSDQGFSGPFGPPSMAGGSTRTFPIPASSCGIPSDAQAYSFNVTAVPPAPLGYLSIWPTGELQPLVSTLNSFDGQVVANAAIVPAGSNGSVNVYASDNTDVVIDIDGYFSPAGSSNEAFYTDTPCRIADTRGNGFAGAFGPPAITGGLTRAFPILSSSCPSPAIPASVQAYSLNVTVVPHGELDYLSLWPEGDPQPLVSTENSFNGRVVANAAIVPVGAPNGGVDVFVSNDTDVVIDIDGHFGPPTDPNPLRLYPVSPCRIADTRTGSGFSDPFGAPSIGAGTIRNFPIPSSSCGIPSTAQAYSLNMTVVPHGAPFYYLTVWPTGQPQPFVSTLNSLNGTVVANAAFVPAGTNGSISVFVTNDTDLIIDINGYFAP